MNKLHDTGRHAAAPRRAVRYITYVASHRIASPSAYSVCLHSLAN